MHQLAQLALKDLLVQESQWGQRARLVRMDQYFQLDLKNQWVQLDQLDQLGLEHQLNRLILFRLEVPEILHGLAILLDQEGQ